MPVYMVIENIEVTDEVKAKEYVTKAKPILESYGAKYLASSDSITAFSDAWRPNRMVIIEFPDSDAVDKCFQSAEYKAIVQLRLDSMKSKAVLVPSL